MKSSTTASVGNDMWVIEPSHRMGVAGEIRELWRFRHVARLFSGKAVQFLYKNTQLGKPWIVLRPVLPIIIGALVFGEVMQLPSLHVPYFLFLLSGTIAWTAFARSLNLATRSLERNRQLVRKIYLPREILPPTAMAAGAVEVLVLIGVLACVIGYYGLAEGQWYLPPRWGVPVALLSLGLAMALALAIGWFTAIWQAFARDTRFIVGWILGFWTYFTPVIYPLEHIPPRWRIVALLNPLTSVVEAFRAATIGAGTVMWPWLAWSAAVAIVGSVIGAMYFKRAIGNAADRL